MMSAVPSDELLRQEVIELTDLLRNGDSFKRLRIALSGKGISVPETILAGLIEGEDGSRYGVILTPTQECIKFETVRNGSFVQWEKVNDLRTLTSAFQAVSIAMAMLSSGEIH